MSPRNQKYPWNVWMDGSIHSIKQGTDFTCGVSQMRNYLYQKATDKGTNVRVYLKRRLDGTVELEFQFARTRQSQEDLDATMREVAETRLAKDDFRSSLDIEGLASKPRPVDSE